MTKVFIGMDHWKMFMALTAVVLLVNAALFWAYMMMKAALPWKVRNALIEEEQGVWKIDKII